MLTRQSQPLERAKALMGEEIINRLLAPSLNNYRAWNILERWAITYPEQLRELAENLGCLEKSLASQLKKERFLDSYEAVEMRRNGLADHEILELRGISQGMPGSY